MVLRRQLGERQAERAAHEPHAGHRPLDRNGVGFDEQIPVERDQPLIDLGGTRPGPANGRGDHVGPRQRAGAWGATFAVTEMTPRAPTPMTSRAVRSSPESTLNEDWQVATSSRTRAASP